MTKVVCPECGREGSAYSFIDLYCAGGPDVGVHREVLCLPPKALEVVENVMAHIEGDRAQDQYERYREAADLARPAFEVKEKEDDRSPPGGVSRGG